MEEYEIAYEENGQIFYSAEKIVLKNKLTGELVAAVYDDKSTHALLTLYAENQNKVGKIPLNPFRTEKEMWTYIAHEYCRTQKTCSTPQQLEERFRNVIRRTKDSLNGMGSKIRIPLEAVVGFRPHPWNARNRLSAVATTNPAKTRQKLIAEQIFDRLMQNSENRFRIRLANKERRHKEMLKRLTELQNSLANKLTNNLRT
ncbi:uncharacterized protein LOC129939687 [Eupeodes corollae]|uniref:uncharacterized protein LOC129939687 n=1 Tax=Eupeodes corollae TaxID=290404 RepID=UPI002492EC66|nr:uncharacterized protein LOC129939687 [Eupeodes corollae]